MQSTVPTGGAATGATPTPDGNGTAGSTETPAAGVGDALADGVAVIQRWVTDLAAAHGRPVASVVLLVVLVLGLAVLPAVARRLRSRSGARPRTDVTAAVVEGLWRLVPTTVGGLVLRTVQTVVAAVVAAALLAVWDVADVAAAAEAAFADREPNLLNAGLTVALLALAVVGSSRLERTVSGFADRVGTITDHQEEIAVRVGQLTLFVAVGAAVLTLWNYDLSGLLVGAGFLGIVVGLAARQTLGAMIAGFVLMFSRPFTIGDWVLIADHEGMVTDITIFNTRLENFDGESVVIPNDVVSDAPVTNRSRKGILRLRTDVGVDYDADPERAGEIATETMASLDAVADDPSPAVIPKSFGDSAVVLELRYWIEDPTPPRKWRAVAAVVREVKAAFDREDVAIPFPQRELSGRTGELPAEVDGAMAPGPTGDGDAAGERSANGKVDGEERASDDEGDGEGRSTDGEVTGDGGPAGDGDSPEE